LRIHTINDRPA